MCDWGVVVVIKWLILQWLHRCLFFDGFHFLVRAVGVHGKKSTASAIWNSPKGSTGSDESADLNVYLRKSYIFIATKTGGSDGWGGFAAATAKAWALTAFWTLV